MDQHKLAEQVNAIHSLDDLTQFLKVFVRDLHEHPEEWENNTLPRFPESLAGWLEDSDGYFANHQMAVSTATILAVHCGDATSGESV